jgi:hypothetical protein
VTVAVTVEVTMVDGSTKEVDVVVIVAGLHSLDCHATHETA